MESELNKASLPKAGADKGTGETLDVNLKLPLGGETRAPFVLDINIRVPGKGVTAIFGHSGSGKTSLLRCIAGLESRAIGSVKINQEIWQNDRRYVPTSKRSIGYVFQESSLFDHLTTEGNLRFARKRAKTRTQGLSENVIDVMGIAHLLMRYPSQLSGGERQRVAIARALLTEPSLLLLDEPLASLDFARKREILPYLERLKVSAQVPILYVSHSVDEVARLADHIVVLEQGQVVAQGSVHEVFSQLDTPSSLQEDTGVLLTGRYKENDPQWKLDCIEISGGDLWLSEVVATIGDKLRVRILAKDISISLSAEDHSSILNRLHVEVAEIVEMTTRSMALVKLKAGDDFLIASITRKSLARLGLVTGMRVWAQIKSVAIVR